MWKRRTYPIRRQEALAYQVDAPGDWLAFRFNLDVSMTWEIRFIDPLGRIRYQYWDVHAPREGVLHVLPELTSYTCVPGPIPSGQWRIELQKAAPGELTLEWCSGTGELPADAAPLPRNRVYWTDGASPDGRHAALNRYNWHAVLNEEARWYRGDFHTHTTLSDGRMTPEQATTLAKQRGLDFFAVTEHNVLPSSWPESKVLVIPGAEITSHKRGDWNAIGLTQSIDYWSNVDTIGLPDAEEAFVERHNRLREQAGRLGAIRSLNHPLAGRLGWRAPGTRLAAIDALEVWRCPAMKRYAPANEGSLLLWTALWNAGYTIPGIGGSDTHYFPDQPFEAGDDPQVIGDPANYVYADGLSAASILQGVRNRQVYLTRGPLLEVVYEVGGRTYSIGNDLTEAVLSSDGRVSCRLRLSGMPEGFVRLIMRGSVIEQSPITGDQETATLDYSFDWSGEAYVWTRIECRAADGSLLAVTNPVFSGAREKNLFTWQELLDCAARIDPRILQLLSE